MRKVIMDSTRPPGLPDLTLTGHKCTPRRFSDPARLVKLFSPPAMAGVYRKGIIPYNEVTEEYGNQDFRPEEHTLSSLPAVVQFDIYHI
jgi:hypothetical protein